MATKAGKVGGYRFLLLQGLLPITGSQVHTDIVAGITLATLVIPEVMPCRTKVRRLLPMNVCSVMPCFLLREELHPLGLDTDALKALASYETERNLSCHGDRRGVPGRHPIRGRPSGVYIAQGGTGRFNNLSVNR